MAIVVEHDKRRAEILKKSLEVFVEEGYDDVTFQKIADRCGITRTTLYIYFKNKREIFLWSIKQLTGSIELKIREVITDKAITATSALRQMLDIIVGACEENRELFSVLLSYLLNLSKTGGDPSERVRRRLVRLQHLLSTIIIKGVKNGEFKQVNVKSANEMLYGLIQSAIFRLSVLGEKDIRDVRDSLNLAVDGLLKV
ncbi:MAG: TetR/AcrR family transcriptional regulator [Treponema sp.]|nr:TetR/AcrR family transcriptional regulator [Treponema sp.]